VTAALFESTIKPACLCSAAARCATSMPIGDDRLLIVTSDRLSAFDVILPDPVPGKGKVLTRLASFWFEKLAAIVPNQLTGIDPETVVAADERAQVRGRALVVKRLRPLPIEAVVRGYLIGSGWKDYQATGSRLRHPAAAGTAPGEPAAASRSSPRRPRPPSAITMKTSLSRARRPTVRRARRPPGVAGKSGEAIATQARDAGDRTLHRRRRACRCARHHHRRHQVRVRPRCCRHAAPDRRSADPGLVAFLAGRRLSRRQQSAVLRQAVPARLSGNAALEQAGTRPKLPLAVIAGTRARYVEACELLTGETFVD
jgi:phosphoribosylaminoimidazole-succinocarboxamide synthase